jgi:4-hydroxy-tetrahydrodipicolinate synthase
MTFDDMRARLAGIVAINVTPFAENGDIDDAAYTNLLKRMADAGIETVTPNGNVSEYYSLTDAEARHSVELSVAAVGAKCLVLAGVGGSIPNAIAAAHHARDAGAQAIMVHQPVNPFVSNEGWVEYNRQIAAAVPDLGVVLYIRNPGIEGVHMAELADTFPNLVGVKYAVTDPIRFASIVRDCNRDSLVWIAGNAELSAPGYWAVGATGFTSGFANVAPSLSLEMLSSLRSGDFGNTMKVWEKIRPFEELRAVRGSADNISVVKETLAQLGLCRRDVRPPITTLSESNRELVREMIQGWSSSL